MPSVIRVGVLLAEDGDFWGGMTGLWNHFVTRFATCPGGIELIPINAITGELPGESELTLYDGFIITGSNYSVNDEQSWIERLVVFVHRIFELDKHKMFGICFGHQLIAKSLGYTVSRNNSGKDVFKTQELQITENFRQKDYYQWVFGNRPSFKIMEAHGESIVMLDDRFEVLAWSDTCEHEVVLWTDRIISTQGHPEFNVDAVVNKIAPMVREHQFLTEDELKESIKTFTDNDTDNTVLFVKAFFIK